MNFRPDRLIQIRENLGINKAEAARRLNISAMAYGRYEKGEREPSLQTVSYIAQKFGCNTDFLYGLSEETNADYLIIPASDTTLYALVEIIKSNRNIQEQVLDYARKLLQ